ncbi:hypothetical protein CMK13_13820 [Candidatus Poribacteria bacterium]|nr:hypothetical protein [Candidatus Poribacteria bacterium]OUT58249.1 MAG: hypothetical protein CBB75_13280 [bacterium TMED15]
MDVDNGNEFAASVGGYSENVYGFYDMVGNVWEYCQDWYGEDYYSNTSVSNPQESETGEERVL